MKWLTLLRVGSRGSALALAQTGEVISKIRAAYPAISVQTQIIKTSGDVYKGERLADAGGKGLFVKEIEEALLRGEIDFAVHSLKDLPGILPEALTIACFPKREDPRDCFVSLKYKSFSALPKGALIGTGSPRRVAQILIKRPDLKVEPIRGNVDTRLKKLQKGSYDALILAAAGLKRLGFEKGEAVRAGGPNVGRGKPFLRVSPSECCCEYFEPDFFIPAIGQGVLAIECRKEDQALLDFLKIVLNDLETERTALAERAFLKEMGGDCYTPMGAFATPSPLVGEGGGEGKMRMIAWWGTPDGKREIRRERKGTIDEPEQLGKTLAREILNAIASDKTQRSV